MQKEIQIAESGVGLALNKFLPQGIREMVQKCDPDNRRCLPMSLGNLNLYLKLKKRTE